MGIEKINFVFMLVCLIVGSGVLMAQYEVKEANEAIERFPWPEGKKAALSLTFDDARFSQIDKGIPLLNEYGVYATFYISPERFVERIPDWKAALKAGHEIGNHTMSHPCTGNYAFSRDNALEDYTLAQITDEIDRANEFIRSHLKIEASSFAYPCGQKFVGRGTGLKSYVPVVADRFFSARGWLGEDSNDPWICDFAQLLAMESDNKSFEELKKLVEKAKEEGRWLILAGHEMDDEGPQTTLLETLRKLCEYATDEENGIWIDSVDQIAVYIEKVRYEGKE